MSAYLFLGIVVLISVAGSLIAWLRSRERETVRSSVDEFRSEMSALDPTADAQRGRRRRRG